MCPTLLQTGQCKPDAADDGFRGKLGEKWSGYLQVKKGWLTSVVSADIHVAMTDQRIELQLALSRAGDHTGAMRKFGTSNWFE